MTLDVTIVYSYLFIYLFNLLQLVFFHAISPKLFLSKLPMTFIKLGPFLFLV